MLRSGNCLGPGFVDGVKCLGQLAVSGLYGVKSGLIIGQGFASSEADFELGIVVGVGGALLTLRKVQVDCVSVKEDQSCHGTEAISVNVGNNQNDRISTGVSCNEECKWVFVVQKIGVRHDHLRYLWDVYVKFDLNLGSLGQFG